MRGDTGPIPHAHELVGWETRLHWQLAYLLGLFLCSLPLLVGAFGLSLAPPLARFTAWLGTRDARETTGFIAGGIVAFQLAFSLRKRLGVGHAIPFHLWRTAHQIAPLALVFVVLLHTRGEAGVNLNR